MKGLLIKTAYELVHSVPSLGAMTTPTDMVTLQWTTTASVACSKFRIHALGDAGCLLRFMEKPTGGGNAPTGLIVPINKDRTAMTSCVEAFYYDADLATGGTVLINEYLTNRQGVATIGGKPGRRRHISLKASTLYQVSLYGTGTNPATIILNWSEWCEPGE